MKDHKLGPMTQQDRMVLAREHLMMADEQSAEWMEDEDIELISECWTTSDLSGESIGEDGFYAEMEDVEAINEYLLGFYGRYTADERTE